MNSMSPHKGISTTTWFVARSYSWPVLGTSSVISCRCRVRRSSAGTRRRPHRWPRQAATGLCRSTFDWHRSSLPAAHSASGIGGYDVAYLADGGHFLRPLRRRSGRCGCANKWAMPPDTAWRQSPPLSKRGSTTGSTSRRSPSTCSTGSSLTREARSAPRGTARSQAHLDRTLPKSGCGHLVRPRRYSGAAWARSGANDGSGRHRIRSSASEGVRACARSSAGCGCRR